MIYAHVFQTEKDARYGFYEFVEPRINDIKWIDGSCFRVRIVKIGDDEHYFMGETMYHKWCIGRTYEMDGELYHSGYQFAGVDHCKERSK